MNIELRGLTPKQVVLCDIMWTIDSKDGVESFISTLPSPDQRECRTLIELMMLEFTDEVQSTDLAQDLLRRF